MSERRASDDVRTSEARAIVRRLIDAGEGLPDSVRRDIVDLSDAAVSPLLEILEDASLALGNAPGGGEAPVHAARLLGSLRAARAVEPMLAVLARTDPLDLLHDQLLESLPEIGASVVEPALCAYAANDDDARAACPRGRAGGPDPAPRAGHRRAAPVHLCSRLRRRRGRALAGARSPAAQQSCRRTRGRHDALRDRRPGCERLAAVPRPDSASPCIADRRDGYQHLTKHGLDERHWSEYVFEAYANHKSEAIFLLGLPDAPESRPHSRGNADRR
jgi:hypothetical protein